MMTKTLKDLLEHAESWPPEDQDELAEYAREIQARRTGIYTMSDEERVAVGKGMAEADQGKFVSDEDVAEADKRNVTLSRRSRIASELSNTCGSARQAEPAMSQRAFAMLSRNWAAIT